jgi:phage terminase Nu1 subunit (DNA packaging protein)
MISLDNQCSQKDFAALIGVSEPAVSGMVKRGVLIPGEALGVWLLAYCNHLREQAAGRSADLTAERAGLAKENKLRARIAKLKELGEWAPIENMTLVLSRVTAQMASQFEHIPVKLKRAYPEMTAEQLGIIREELDAARNLLVTVGEESGQAALFDAESRLMDYVDGFDDGATAQE